jgi:hypothetical protein
VVRTNATPRPSGTNRRKEDLIRASILGNRPAGA